MINTEIWGLPENWNTFDDDNIIAVIKQPSCIVDSYNYRTFFRLAENNKIDLNSDIDTSLCVSGMGSECPYSNVNYYTVKNGVVESDSQTRNLTNWFFFNTPQKSAYTEQNYVTYLYNDDHYGQYRNFENTLSDTSNGNRWITPFIDYDIKDFVLLLRVECSDSPTGSQHYYFLDDYLSTYYNTYPYVFRIFARLYAKSGTSPLRRKYIYQGTIEGSHYCTTAICDSYETTLVQTNKRVYCNHISGLRGNNIPIWGSSIDKNYTYFPCSSYDENGLIGIVYGNTADFETTVQNGNLYVYHHVTEISAFAEKARRAAAAFGCYFTGDEDTAEYGVLTDNKMYIGVLDDNLIAHGDYLQGTNTATAIQNTWETVRDSTYNPIQGDKTKYKNDTQFYAGYGTSSFTKFYALTETQVNQLSQELYRIANDVPSGTSITEYNMKMFLTNNPIDCIISLKKFPVENIPLASSDATIYLGAKATNITGKILATPTWVYYFSFKNSADQSCRPIFGDNFLDYEPYTKCKIVIPFCGTVDVPVSYIYQYDDLQIALVMDFITGAVTAFILVNGITIDSITGSCAIDLPVSGIQSATLDSQIHSVAMAREKQQTTLGTGLIAGAVSIGIGLATGSLPVAIGGGAAIIGSFMHAEDTGKQINYDLTHMQTPVKQVSAASGQISHTYDMRCKMVITRPEIAAEYSAEEYSKTIGFACLENGEVQNFHGLTLANIDLSGINCTAEEKNMIRAAFANGVYLPAEYSDTYWT